MALDDHCSRLQSQYHLQLNRISHGAKAKSTVSKPNIHEGVRSNRLGLLLGFDSSTHPPNENEVGVEKLEETNTTHDMNIMAYNNNEHTKKSHAITPELDDI